MGKENLNRRQAAGEMLDAFAGLAQSLKKVLESKEVDGLVVALKTSSRKIDKYNEVATR